MILPFGYPPTPSALSRVMDPLDTVETLRPVSSPSFMTAPLPNDFSMFFITVSIAFCLSSIITLHYFFSVFIISRTKIKSEHIFAFKCRFLQSVRIFAIFVLFASSLTDYCCILLQNSFSLIFKEYRPAFVEVFHPGQDCKEYRNVHGSEPQ